LRVSDHDVTAGDPAGHVQPQISRLGDPKSKLVVFCVSAPHEHLEALDNERAVGPSLARHG
jgi:hypothetical protein